MDKIFGKKFLKNCKIGQDQNTLVSAFAYFLTSFSKNPFLQGDRVLGHVPALFADFLNIILVIFLRSYALSPLATCEVTLLY